MHNYPCKGNINTRYNLYELQRRNDRHKVPYHKTEFIQNISGSVDRNKVDQWVPGPMFGWEVRIQV